MREKTAFFPCGPCSILFSATFSFFLSCIGASTKKKIINKSGSGNARDSRDRRKARYFDVIFSSSVSALTVSTNTLNNLNNVRIYGHYSIVAYMLVYWRASNYLIMQTDVKWRKGNIYNVLLVTVSRIYAVKSRPHLQTTVSHVFD